MFVAIDPGAHPGWAVLRPDMVLLSCGIGDPASCVMFPPPAYKVLIIEQPTIYPKQKVPAKDILTLSRTAGDQASPFRRAGVKVVWVEPRTWKGQVPKNIHHARIMDALTSSERSVVMGCLLSVSDKLQEDAMDAVGLAVYGRKFGIFRAS